MKTTCSKPWSRPNRERDFMLGWGAPAPDAACRQWRTSRQGCHHLLLVSMYFRNAASGG